MHSYWAANIWAAFVFANKYIINIYRYIIKEGELQCIYDVDT